MTQHNFKPVAHAIHATLISHRPPEKVLDCATHDFTALLICLSAVCAADIQQTHAHDRAEYRERLIETVIKHLRNGIALGSEVLE
jgi:hypothetical protein